MIFALAGCTFSSSGADWADQVAPSGACYAFNFMDGVVAGDNSELHAAFECLNRQGMVDPLRPLDVALDAATRTDNVGGSAVRWLEEVGDEFTLSDRDSIERWLHLGLELAYAASVEEIGSSVAINSTTSLEGGVLLPLAATARSVATSVLDERLAPLDSIGAVLRSEATPRWLWTLALAPEAPDRDLAALAEDWPAVLASVIDRTSDATNDRNPGPHSHSLRDGVLALTSGEADVELIAAAAPLLSDSFARDQLAAWVIDESRAGRWADLDDGLVYLASVDREGQVVRGGEDTALVSLIRLLHDANQPVVCSVDLLLFDLEVDIGNLAVELLESMAQIDPETAVSGVDLLGGVLGSSLTEAILGAVAESGACPVIDPAFVADLASIDRLSDPSAEPLLRAMLGLLAAADGQIESVANTAGALHENGLVDPLEEILYDLGGTSALRSVLEAVPALVDPDGRQAASAFPAGVRPVDIGAIFDLVLAWGDRENRQALSPIVDTAIAQASTWTAVDHAQDLLTRSGTTTSQALVWLREGLNADPQLTCLSTAADRVTDAAVATSALEWVENDALHRALWTTELTRVGPVPWLAQLYVGGTVDTLWDTLDLFLPFLGASDA